MRWPMLMLAASLAGCVSPEQLAKMDDAKCQDIGTVRGTREYAACRLILEERRIADAKAVGAAIAGGLKAQSDAYNRAAQAYRPPMTCRTTQWGNTATTNCY